MNNIGNNLDIHEILTQELINESKTDQDIQIDTIFDMPIDQFKQAINPTVKKAYLCLDGTNPLSVSNDKTVYTWNYFKNQISAPGSTNSTAEIKNIVSIKIYDFYIQLDPTNNVSPYYDDQMLATIYIPELSAQCFIGPQNSNFHFWGKMQTYVQALYSAPNYLIRFRNGADGVGVAEPYYRLQDGNEGEFKFNTPITKLDTISIIIKCPYVAIPLTYNTFCISLEVSYIG